MSQPSRRRLPPHELPLLQSDGKINLEWYAYFRFHDQEHGGESTDRLVRSTATGPATTFPTAVAGATGLVEIVIDGTTYSVVFE